MDTSPLDKRSKLARPEYIEVGDEVFERQDLTAKRFGRSERSLNREDKNGAPWRIINGVKYRPKRRYDAYILGSIEVRKPQRIVERVRSGRHR